LHLGGLFRSLLEDDELIAQMRTADTVVQYVYRKPEARITCRLLAAEDAQVDFGPTALVPEVTLTMDADVAHRFWLGKVNITFAVARGQIRTQGPVKKMLSLAPLVQRIVPRYRAQLEASGRT